MCLWSLFSLTILTKVGWGFSPLVNSRRNLSSFLGIQISHFSVNHKQVADLCRLLCSSTDVSMICSTLYLTTHKQMFEMNYKIKFTPEQPIKAQNWSRGTETESLDCPACRELI